MTRLGVAWRLALMTAAFAVLAPMQVASLRFGWRLADRIPMWFHRLFLRLFGVVVRVRGRPPGGAPTLVLANHVSWLDIAVIGSLAPLSFIAKSEIAGWPVFGLFAALQRSVFIDRARRTHTAVVNAAVARRLAQGDVIVLFAEGTTSDGNRVLPFRSSLVGAARAALSEEKLDRIHLQPLGIAYVRRNGLPVTRRERPAIAWYGDMELGPHLAAFVREGPLDVVVAWGDPIPFDGASDRKQATAQAEIAVRRAVKGDPSLAAPDASRPHRAAFPILSTAQSA
jgi:1-acyl-sn-glycerol-3-phosphate acyltransferase